MTGVGPVAKMLHDGGHAAGVGGEIRRVDLPHVAQADDLGVAPARVISDLSCLGVKFCASSMIRKVSLRVRPRMNPGARICTREPSNWRVASWFQVVLPSCSSRSRLSMLS